MQSQELDVERRLAAERQTALEEREREFESRASGLAAREVSGTVPHRLRQVRFGMCVRNSQSGCPDSSSAKLVQRIWMRMPESSL